MSLSDCFKKLKLDKGVVAEIKKDIKKLVKKGMGLSEAEQMAIDNQIEKTKSEVESVREKIGGDLSPVEFKVDEVKVFNQAKKKKSLASELFKGKEFSDIEFSDNAYSREDGIDYIDMPKASKKRAEKAGFDTDYPWFHGTKANIESFSNETLGGSTGAGSAKIAHFFASSPVTASDYASASSDKNELEYKRKSGEINKEIARLEEIKKPTKKNKEDLRLLRDDLERVGEKYGDSLRDQLTGGQRSDLEHREQSLAAVISNLEEKVANGESVDTKRIKDLKDLIDKNKKLVDMNWVRKGNAWNVLDKNGIRISNPVYKSIDDVGSFVKGETERQDSFHAFYTGKEHAQSAVERYTKALKSIEGLTYQEHLTDAKEELAGIKERLAKDSESNGGEVVYPTVLKMTNPLIADFKDSGYREVTYREILEKAQANGYDGVIFKNTYDPAFNGQGSNRELIDVAAVFEPTQIRSVFAQFKKLDSPNILYQSKKIGESEQKSFPVPESVKTFSIEKNNDIKKYLNGPSQLKTDMVKTMGDGDLSLRTGTSRLIVKIDATSIANTVDNIFNDYDSLSGNQPKKAKAVLENSIRAFGSIKQIMEGAVYLYDRGSRAILYSVGTINGKESVYKIELEKKGETYSLAGISSEFNQNAPLSTKLLADGSDSLGKINIAQFQSSVNAARNNRLLFQDNSDVKRGSIEFQKERNIIRLFKDADKSTFVHEMGHLFLQDMYEHVLSGDASNRAMNDWMKLSAWLGYNPAQSELTEEQHEKFARGFETYLMEGRAPTKTLQRAFGQFRKWLTSIYKSVKSLDAELNPEVRDIMDRMLATESEIAIARKASGLDTVLDLTDIPANVVAKLNDIKLMAEEKAFGLLMKDQMREISTEHKEFIKEKTKEITIQVRAEIEASPEGAEIVDIQGVLKAKDIWGIADKFINGMIDEDAAVVFEMQGEEFGYSSGDHFAQAIKGMTPISEQVKTEVEIRMKEFSSFTDKEVIRENAMRVIHNEKSIELLGMENEIIRKRLMEETEKENDKIVAAMERFDEVLIKDWLISKERFKQQEISKGKIERLNEKHEKELERLSERAKERAAREDQKRLAKEFLAAKDEFTRKTKIKEFRDSVNSLNRIIAGYTRSEADIVRTTATAILAGKSIKEASKYEQYYIAERKAALRVAKAISDNDWKRAHESKQQQVLNHALARESLKIRKEVARHTKYLDGQKSIGRETFKNEDHFFQAAKILARFGFERKDFDLNTTGATLSTWVQENDAMSGIVSIEDWILDERINIKTSELKIDQLREIRQAIQNIKRVANYESEISMLNRKQTSAEIAGELIQESQKSFNPKSRFKNKFEDSKFDKMKGWMRLYMFSLKKVETVLGPLGAWKDNSLWLKYFSGSVATAADNESRMIQNSTKEIGKNWSMYTDQERKDIYNKKIFIPEFGGDVKTGVSLTKDKLLAMAHNLGNEGNRERLFATRPVGLDQSIPWGEGMIMVILQRELTVKDWAFVQANLDHIGSYGQEVAALGKRQTGFTPKMVEARPFSVITKDGIKVDMRGGYYPLKADPRNSFKDEVRDNADTPLYNEQNMAWKAATKKGHTKERVKAQYPVSLDLGIINRHLQEVIHDLAFRETVFELNKLISREDMQAEMKSTLTPEGYKAIKEYVGAVAGVQNADPISAIDKTIKVLRQNTTRAALFWKVSVVSQNFANALIFPNAVEGFGYADAFKSYMKYGIGDYTLKLFSSEGKEIREMVYSKSAFMKDRADSPDYSIEEIHSKFSKDQAGEITKMAGGMMAWTDEFSNIPMWLGAYNKSISEGKSEADSVRYADTLIKRVAGSSRKYDVAAISRGSETQKIFSMFFSWLNTEHNRWMREFGIVTRDKDVSRALGFLAGRLVFQAAGAALMFRLPDPDDEEEVKKFLVNISIGLPASFLPGVRDVAGVVIDKALGLKGFGYNPSPVFAGIEYGVNGVGAVIDVAKGDVKPKIAAEKVSKAASYGFGYPDQFNQWFFNIYDYTEGMEPKIQDIYRRRPKEDRRK